MITRPIQHEELNDFAQISTPSARINRFSNMVSSMWESGESRPEWCFIVEDDHQSLGRIGFMAVDGRSDEVAVFGWALPWEDDFSAVGHHLLQESLSQIEQQGVRSVQRELHSDWAFVKEQAQMLESAGFALLQEQYVYEYLASSGPVDSASQLKYKPLDVIGDEAFIDMICQATAGTLDRNIQNLVQEMGIEAFVKTRL